MLKQQATFLRDLLFNKQYSENTIAAYKRDLLIYEDFLKTKKDLSDFYHYLTKRQLSPRSQVRIISCVRMYFKYLQSRGVSTPDIHILKFPKLESTLPKIIRIEEFRALMEVSTEKQEALTLRNHLVLSFLYGLGCRVSELIQLNLEDFNPTESWVSVTGKGNRQRLLPLTQELFTLLNKYLKEARPLLLKTETGALLMNNKGKRPSRVDIWRWLKKWSQQAGFKEVKNPHSFRHGCATGLLEQGADLRSIQKLLGHFNIQTTQIYTSVTSKYLKEAIDKYHPLSKSESLVED
ncbi:MAG: tyrosine-type recombinase/integrase [Bdellovibrionales bacterium]